MAVRYKKSALAVINGIALLILSLLQFFPVKLFNIGLAVPVLAIGFTVSVSFYFGEFHGAIWGLIAGMCFDALSSKTCFSTITLAMIGLVVGLLITYVFNRNLGALAVLMIISSAAYFIADIITNAIFIYDISADYVLSYSLPSFVYTAVMGIMISFIYRLIVKKLK